MECFAISFAVTLIHHSSNPAEYIPISSLSPSPPPHFKPPPPFSPHSTTTPLLHFPPPLLPHLIHSPLPPTFASPFHPFQVPFSPDTLYFTFSFPFLQLSITPIHPTPFRFLPHYNHTPTLPRRSLARLRSPSPLPASSPVVHAPFTASQLRSQALLSYLKKLVWISECCVGGADGKGCCLCVVVLVMVLVCVFVGGDMGVCGKLGVRGKYLGYDFFIGVKLRVFYFLL